MRKLISFFVLTFVLSGLIQTNLQAEESVCAVVKIEIKQELTLERQAFNAKMKITNALDTASLDDVKIEVSFQNEDGNPVLATNDPGVEGADFYIRLDDIATSGITAVDGTESIPAASEAEIHWLIIPAPGSGGAIPSGKLYYVGAKLTYYLAGEEKVVEVSPDAIYVKPMPMLELDYFLTEDVYADDPMTDLIEPAEPFTLGVRIKNNGNGIAKNIKIDSAQPKIIENEQGLLIGFEIISSYLNDNQAENTLLIDFGDIESNTSKVGRWVMQTTLSGKFTALEAQFTHADDLGGELTSLIDLDSSEATHLLIKDVIVDLPGKDSVKDFLAKDGDVIRVYQSDAVDTDVSDHSSSTVFSQQGVSGSDIIYTMEVPATAGPLYTKVADPFSQTKKIKSVIRQDGKLISLDNAWLSKTKNASKDWEYFFNLFDVNSGGEYTVIFTDETLQNRAPVIQFISQKTVQEGTHLGFLIEATDQDGTIPTIQVNNIPTGATYTDQGNGKGEFSWTPQVGQKGRYQVEVVATDSVLTATRIVTIQVNSIDDADGDGIADSWENDNFGDLDQDGTGDADGDGYSDYEEYLKNTDPNTQNGADAPTIHLPENEKEITELKPHLTVKNSPNLKSEFYSYSFKIFSDEARANLVASIPNVVEGSGGFTSWRVPEELSDNSRYFWEAKVYNGSLFSQNAYGQFFVNTKNDAPGGFALSQPQSGATIDILSPDLSINNSVDIDGDTITYKFEVYSDLDLTQSVAFAEVSPESNGTTTWHVGIELTAGQEYFWRVIATDEHGLQTISNTVNSFTVNYTNVAPEQPGIIAPEDYSEVATRLVNLTTTKAIDLNEDQLSYRYQVDTVDTFDSVNLIDSGLVEIGSEEPIVWVTPELQDNTTYYWRLKAFDPEMAESNWIGAQFFVNSVNDKPTVPVAKSPTNDSWVEVLQPQFEIFPSSDIDKDQITYDFELYADENLEYSIKTENISATLWEIEIGLPDNHWYYWRARSVDEHGEKSDWTQLFKFFVNNDGIDDSPQITIVEPSDTVHPDVNNNVFIRWEDEDPDSSATISIYYDTDNEGFDGTLLVENLGEDLDEASDQYNLNVNGISAGIYYLYAVISDGNSQDKSYAQGALVIGEVVITVDNTDPQVVRNGQWVSSQLNAGYLGTDYEYHAGSYISNDQGTVIDSNDASFAVTGNWETTGCCGFEYKRHAPNQPAAGGTIVDENDVNVSSTGSWFVSYTGMGQQYGTTYKYHMAGIGNDSYKWNIPVDNAGEFKVYAKWVSTYTRAVDAKYTIDTSNGPVDVTVNQQLNGGKWQLLGTFSFDDIAEVSLSQNATGTVAADAVQIVPTDAKPNSATWDLNAIEAGKYLLYARWTAVADNAMDSKYQVQHANGSSTIEVDQRKNSGRWNLLGIYDFDTQTDSKVTLTDQASGYVVADSIMAVPYSSQNNHFKWTPQVPLTGNYRVSIRWVASYLYADDAKFIINGADRQEAYIANQKENDGQWIDVGNFKFEAGISGNVILYADTGVANSYVIADAIKIELILPVQ